ncbi:uncharacterized protein LOC144911162 [Branchiostoma floridae x Branchiostoma belcheri]
MEEDKDCDGEKSVEMLTVDTNPPTSQEETSVKEPRGLDQTVPQRAPHDDKIEILKTTVAIVKELESPEKARLALSTLQTMLSNILANPEKEAYRRIRVDNKRFQKAIMRSRPAHQCVIAAGWVQVENTMVFTTEYDQILQPALDIIREVLSTLPEDRKQELMGIANSLVADLQRCDKPIHLASMRGNVNVVELLLRKNPRLIHQRDKTLGMTPLHLAVLCGHLPLIKKLLQHGADVNSQNKIGSTPMHIAIHRERLDVGECLIEAGCDLHIEDKECYNALHRAVVCGSVDFVRKILETEDDIDRQCSDHQTSALHLACAYQQTKIAEMLISAGADVNLKLADDRTALHMAADYGADKIAEMLIRNGCDVNALTKENRLTALHKAASEGSFGVAKILIKEGCDVNALETSHGVPALFAAAQSGYTDIVKALLEAGANVNDVETEDGWTNLFVAAKNGHVEIVKILIEAGCKDLPNNDGWTALHAACARENVEITRMIIEHYAEKGSYLAPRIKSQPHTFQNTFDELYDDSDRLDQAFSKERHVSNGDKDGGSAKSPKESATANMRRLMQRERDKIIGERSTPTQGSAQVPDDKKLNPDQQRLRRKLQILARAIGPIDGRKLARELDVRNIENIHANNQQYGVEECNYQCFLKWLNSKNNEKPPTAMRLSQALDNIGRRDLVEQLDLPSPSSTHEHLVPWSASSRYSAAAARLFDPVTGSQASVMTRTGLVDDGQGTLTEVRQDVRTYTRSVRYDD